MIQIIAQSDNKGPQYKNLLFSDLQFTLILRKSVFQHSLLNRQEG